MDETAIRAGQEATPHPPSFDGTRIASHVILGAARHVAQTFRRRGDASAQFLMDRDRMERVVTSAPIGSSIRPASMRPAPARSASNCIFLACLPALLAACAARTPDFGGRWRPVNRYADMPREIPLQRATVFAATPVDGTLRNLLLRWARDAHLQLDYRHPSDFTLHRAAAEVRSADVREAAARVEQAYAEQRVAISVEEGRIVVQPASTVANAPP